MGIGPDIMLFVERLRERQCPRTQGIATVSAVLPDIAARQQGGEEAMDGTGVEGNAVAEVEDADAIPVNGEGFQNV
jgi:hypothetical protein